MAAQLLGMQVPCQAKFKPADALAISQPFQALADVLSHKDLCGLDERCP